MTTIHSERTLFGGLAKVLTPQQTGHGAWKNTATHYLLTMKYCQGTLKVFRNEMLRDEDKNPIEWTIVHREIVNFDTNHPETNEREIIDWRESIWNFSMARSLEIWQELSNQKIASSLGQLTKFAQRSLQGKLSSGKGKYYEKLNNGNWKFIALKQTPYQKEFAPFSIDALEHCKKRARANK